MRNIIQEGIDLTKDSEGLNLTIYGDTGNPPNPTVGWGHKVTAEDGLMIGDTITQEQADQLFLKDQAHAASIVEQFVTVPLTDNQFAALVDFVFNVGSGRFERSTLLKYLQSGDYESAAQEFGRWIYAGGIPSDGLEKRREKEIILFKS